MSVKHITDHPERALGHMLSQFDASTNMRIIVEELAKEVQAFDDVATSCITARMVNSSKGAQLDQWGKVLGEPRGGLKDRDYRRFILARIMSNVSNGLVNELISIYEVVTAPSEVRFFEHYPAGFRLLAIRAEWMSDGVVRRVVRMMSGAQASGAIGMRLTEALDDAILLGDEGRGFDHTLSRVLL